MKYEEWECELEGTINLKYEKKIFKAAERFGARNRNLGIATVCLQVMAILCCVAKNSLRGTAVNKQKFVVKSKLKVGGSCLGAHICAYNVFF